MKKTRISGLAMAVILVCHPATAADATGLIAHWSFDEGRGTTLNDGVGGHHGEIHGATWMPEGRFGGALMFDGVNDYVAVNNAQALTPGKLTVAGWFNPTSYNNGIAYVNALSSESRMNGWSFYLNCSQWGGVSTGGTQRAMFHVYTGYSWTEGHGLWAGAYGLNKWVHFAMTCDGDAVRGYVNGNLMAVNTNVSADVAPASYVGIGGSCVYGTWGQFFHGMIDEVRIYNRALSGDEIYGLYGQGAGSRRGTLRLFSDTATEWWDGSAWQPAVIGWNYSRWIRTTGSKWIWTSYLVDSADKCGPFTFRKTFTIPEGAYDISGTFVSAIDNAYKIRLNGSPVMEYGLVTSPPPTHAEAPPFEFWPPRSGMDICTIFPKPGVNELTIEAVNYSDPVDPYSNPAGLNYETYIAYALPTSTYNLVVGCAGLGRVEPAGGPYEAGTEVTLTAKPGLGYQWVGWIGDVPEGSESENPLTVVMNKNRMLTARFRAIPMADVCVTKTASSPNVQPGAPLVYTVQVRNAGPGPATGVQVTDPLPKGVEPDYSIAGGGTYSAVSGVWSVGSLAVSNQAVLRINTRVATPVVLATTVLNSNTVWSITNVASVTAMDQEDPELQNNIDFAVVTVTRSSSEEKALTAEININPNNNADHELVVVLPDGSRITRDTLTATYQGYTGPAVAVHVKPKGGGEQNNLVVNGKVFTLMNSDSYDIESDAMTIQLRNDQRDGAGNAIGQWLISITTTNAALTCVRADSDRDGICDWSEWMAGTSSTNARDMFVLKPEHGSAEKNVKLSCSSRAGRLYCLQTTTNPADRAAWCTTESKQGIDDEAVVFTNTPPPGKSFYRITVEQQP